MEKKTKREFINLSTLYAAWWWVSLERVQLTLLWSLFGLFLLDKTVEALQAIM
jgi:hypothetical protein